MSALPAVHATGRWSRFTAAVVRTFHAYASWLVGISWKRFALLSVLLLVLSAVLSEVPPFTWKLTERMVERRPPKVPATRPPVNYEVTIDDAGVRVVPRPPAASAPPIPQGAPSAPSPPPRLPSFDLKLPPGTISEQTRRAIADAVQEATEEVREAIDQADAAREAALAGHPKYRVVAVSMGDYLVDIAMLWIVASIIVKITYKGRMQAEVKAAQATETAESELLKRQVIEARMAAMQAQVEPHFLFNTLASIDHLIEVDAKRASVMQKNLIALLRASMPTLRETKAQGAGNLARELAVVRPYLEILKVRMEDRLQAEIAIPEGLHSAEFPPLMMQSLVENAIKHGLEPKPDGGRLRVAAEIVHGKLVVTVADTGLGFGKAPTAGTGVGLANIRERLALLYGERASLVIAENEPGGTLVRVTVPYQSIVLPERAA